MRRPPTYPEQSWAARRAIVQGALDAHDGNRTAAALTLGIRRTYLQRLIRKFGFGGPIPRKRGTA